WELIILYAYHATLLSLLMAMGLIDQDRQRIPRGFLFFAGAVVCGALAGECWFLYPERTRNVRINEWKAPFDAAFGAIWGAAAWLVPLAATRRRSSDAMKRFFRNAAIASAIAGGFLGLRAIVRVFALWFIGVLASRGVKAASKIHLSPLLILWIVTLVHLAFWGPLAKLISW